MSSLEHVDVDDYRTMGRDEVNGGGTEADNRSGVDRDATLAASDAFLAHAGDEILRAAGMHPDQD